MARGEIAFRKTQIGLIANVTHILRSFLYGEKAFGGISVIRFCSKRLRMIDSIKNKLKNFQARFFFRVEIASGRGFRRGGRRGKKSN